MQPGIRLTLPGSLRPSVVGTSITEPTPDVDPDAFIVPFLRAAAQLAAPGWVVSDERFGESGEWGRGDLGGEDTFDGLVQVGTREHYLHMRRHYSEPEQEMFPTARHEYRWYTVYGLPPRRDLAVHVSREWLAGALRAATVSLQLKLPARLKAKLIEEFRAAFESRE